MRSGMSKTQSGHRRSLRVPGDPQTREPWKGRRPCLPRGPRQAPQASAVTRSDRYNGWESILAWSSSCPEGWGASQAVRGVPKHFEAAANLVYTISIALACAEAESGLGH